MMARWVRSLRSPRVSAGIAAAELDRMLDLSTKRP